MDVEMYRNSLINSIFNSNHMYLYVYLALKMLSYLQSLLVHFK